MPSQALVAFLNQHLGQDWQLYPVRQGAVNSAWRVVASHRLVTADTTCSESETQYFVKVQGAASYNAIARAAEVALQRALHQDGIAPAILAHSADYSLQLQSWIEAPTLAHCAPAMQLYHLAQALAQVHQLTPELAPWSLRERVLHYLSGVDAHTAKPLRARLVKFEPLLTAWDREPPVFGHHDLAFDHIFMSEPMRIVDWEYAGYGHPLFDLASAAVINQLSAGDIVTLSRAYTQASGRAVNGTELTRWCQLVALINHIWLAAQQAGQGA